MILYLRFALLLILAMLLIALVPGKAAAADWRVEGFNGACRYTEVGNYIWQNDKYEIDKHLTAGCGLVAVSSVSKGAGTIATGWRLAYAELGTASIIGTYPLIDAEQLLPAFDGSDCNPKTSSGCLGRGLTSQRARGISAGWVVEDQLGQAVVGAELGLYIYDGEFNATIYPEGPPADWLPASGVTLHWRGVQATPFVGATLRYDYIMMMVRVYGNVRAAEHGCGYCSGLAKGPLTQVLFGLSVPF